MAFLIPSAPSASVPYGSLDEPEILLSSDTRSDSSLLKAEEENKKQKMSVVPPMNGDQRQRVTYRSTENICEMRPTARILFLITLRRSALSRSAVVTTLDDGISALSLSSSCVHILSTAASMSVTMTPPSVNHQGNGRRNLAHSLFSPTNGRLQLNASIKFGSQYGCGMLLNCRMLNMFASYWTIAALLL